MESFLHKVAKIIKDNCKDELSDALVILPSKRASLFLKRELAKVYERAIICPEIISAEELISELSGFTPIEPLQLSIELYRSYQKIYKSEAEDFESFLKWHNMLLQDFNEIDRYLIDSKQIFTNLKDIKEIEEWSLSKEPLSPMQKDYLKFMERLQDIYEDFTNQLITKKISYQGLAYKFCIGKIKNNNFLTQFSNIFVCGFNALNAAEEKIFSDLVLFHRAKIIWDSDSYYLNKTNQEAGQFLRKHFKNDFLKGQLIEENEWQKGKKNIKIIAAPKNFSQSIICNKILSEICKEDKMFDRTALVLADENILIPIVSGLPNEVREVNVSLEYPMKQTVLFDFLTNLLNLHLNKIKKNKGEIYYYKDLEKVIQNPYFQLLNSQSPSIRNYRNWVNKSNKTYIGIKKLEYYFGQENGFEFIFNGWTNSKDILKNFQKITNEIEEKIPTLQNSKLVLETEILLQTKKTFIRLEEYLEQEDLFSDPETFKIIFQQLITNLSAPFYGEPLVGLQIMGVLETRLLDFENIILTSANENILPSGKSQNSFFPNDLKRHFKLPTYADKDAIYAYHFFRMLQRAKNIFILYNTETDRSSSAEKSRFVTQLQIELSAINSEIEIEEHFYANGRLEQQDNKIEFRTNEYSNAKLIDRAKSGYSVTFINNFKDCSLKFYLQNILFIQPDKEIEETVEAGTLGKIIHKVLELSYAPFLKKTLNLEDLKTIKKELNKNSRIAFKESYTDDEITEGKNLLALETVKNYAERILKQDENLIKTEIENGSSFSIIEIETTLKTDIQINYKGKPLTVTIKGICDRIEKTKSCLRIVDYKSSINKTKDKFTIENIADLFIDSKYNKALQLFLYAWLAWKNNLSRAEEIETAIYPLRGSEKTHFELIKEKEKIRFTEEYLLEFEDALVSFISRLLNEDLNFKQTEDKEVCKFCDYNRFCNRSHLS